MPHGILNQGLHLTQADQSASRAETSPRRGNSEKFLAYTQARIQHWTEFARTLDRWQRPRAYYQRRLAEIYSFLIPPGMRVLEVGCGQGDLLSALKPSY